MTAAAAKPRIIVSGSYPVVPKDGRKPEPSERKPAGNGEICWFCRTICAAPRNASMPASVTMNAGIPKYAIQKPCQAPTSAPTTRQSTTAIGHGMFHCVIITPAMAPVKATTDPTDRSMCPAMMTMTMPMARMRM